MSDRRPLIAVLLVLFLAVNAVVWWWFNWGMISLDAKEMPLSKVLDSFRRQGRIPLTCNVDPAMPITLQLRRVPVPEALDVLAGHIGASWSLAYIIASDDNGVRDGFQALASPDRPEGWTWISRGLPMMIDIASGAPPPDPRKARFEPDPPVGAGRLTAVAGRVAESGDIAFFFKSDWDPQVTRPPRPGSPLPRAAKALAKSLGARMGETFVLAGRSMGRGERGDGPPGEGPPRTGREGEGRRGAGPDRPEDARWIERRIEQRIAGLPKTEQAEAREEWKSERQFWEVLRELPPEERRAKMEEHFNDPNFQQRMDERMARREGRSSPERRQGRYRGYLERKQQAQERAGKN